MARSLYILVRLLTLIHFLLSCTVELNVSPLALEINEEIISSISNAFISRRD